MGIGARNPRYEVVFFDLYGTLIDIRTDEQSEAAWQALYDCVTELGAQYESVDVMRDQFEKLEAREMVHQADRAIVRNGWDEFDILPVYRSLLMNRSEEAEKKLALPQAALKAGAMVTSEVELFFEFCPCEIVAVTGSDGKTTTTTLISKMFEAAGRKVFLGGNIGAALLPQLADVTSDAVAVVELSSFQLISMRRSPKVAVVTNVTPNHLDHHKDMQEYIDAKRNILLWQTPPCRAVLGFENDITRGMEKDCKGEQVWFTRLHETDRGAFLRESDDTLCYAENGVVTPILPRKEIQLRGLHNVENLLAACAAVWGRVPIEAMRQVGSTFTGVEHRIEPVRTLDGVTYYNDSIASSPTRTIAGLRSFDQKIILIAGGYDKKIPYEPLAPEVLAHVKTLVLMGATGPRIEKAVRECDGFAESGLTILHADSMQHAVELARGAAKPGDVVSLSPASASFDLYPNFEVRGRDYKNIVKNLK